MTSVSFSGIRQTWTVCHTVSSPGPLKDSSNNVWFWLDPGTTVLPTSHHRALGLVWSNSIAHFPEETKVLRAQMTCPQSHRKQEAEQRKLHSLLSPCRTMKWGPCVLREKASPQLHSHTHVAPHPGWLAVLGTVLHQPRAGPAG